MMMIKRVQWIQRKAPLSSYFESGAFFVLLYKGSYPSSLYCRQSKSNTDYS